jgi:O-antigen chain-terminating methyltransferase
MNHPETAREAEIEAIFERLRREVRSAAPAHHSQADATDAWRLARDEAERAWPITAERPYATRPGRAGRLRGLLLTPLKGVLRRLMRWYVEPLAADQKAFNAAVLRLLDDLADRLARADERLSGRIAETANAVTVVPELEDRVTRLERTRPGRTETTGGGAASREASPGAGPPIRDYFGFEARMRGPTADVRRRQELYVEEFRGRGTVLDIGCGRGEFLGLLEAAAIPARGIDLDPEMVAFCRGEGLEVEEAEAVAHLEEITERSLGGIFAAQVVEHLPPQAIVRLLELAAVKLVPAGVLILETVNPLSFVALRHYFADLTHSQPLVPDTLELLARQAGFAQVEIRFLNEPSPEERLLPIEAPPDWLPEPVRHALDRNVARLNEVVFGPQDYALVARA